MNAFDLAFADETDDYRNTLDAMASHYQKQAYLAGLTQAKQAWDALHAPPRCTRSLTQRSTWLLIALVGLALGLTGGSALYILANHPTLSVTHMPHLHPLSYWLNLVK